MQNYEYLLFVFLISFIVTSPAQVTIPQMEYKVLITDEGNQNVHYVDIDDQSKSWSIPIASRDMQLIGNGKLLLHTSSDFQEYDLKTHAQLKKVTVKNGSIETVFRTNTLGNTYVGVSGSQLLIVDASGNLMKSINISGITSSIRLIRPTMNNTFLVGGGGSIATNLCEFDTTGKKIWEVNVGGEPYQAVRLPNGNTIVSNGYGAQIVIVNSKAEVIRKFPKDPKASSLSTYNPYFFAGFQVLKNGNIVIANWQGHGPGHGNSGAQLLEFDSTGTLLSYWKQNPSIVSSLHGVLVLDDLDPAVLNSDINGVLGPVNQVNLLSKNNFSIIHRTDISDKSEFTIAGKLLSQKRIESSTADFLILNQIDGKCHHNIVLKK